ncbi:cytochrome b N-terminal domain-containing protein [Streptomyces olivaceoviridis]|uniref:cytochrome b N-terminal domain-containing protein n=1 Tax=Streptomyces olivaceoviridis TaxID=1921 RepID=UPI0036F59AA2
MLTGVWLTFFFHPGMTEKPYTGSYLPLRGTLTSEAYASVLHIGFDVRGGLPVRQLRHWAALVFVAAIGVHLLRIFFTGAFRRPREVDWTIGIIPRLYVTHILLVPGMLPALVTAHLRSVVHHKHTQWARPGRTNRNVPQYTAKSMGLFFVLSGVLAAMAALFQTKPVWSFGPYRADQVSLDAQPDWYVG